MKKIYRIFVTMLFLASGFYFQSCRKDEPKPIVKLPVVSTASVTNITETTATAGGEVTLEGDTPITARGVCWDTSPDPDITGNKTTESGTIGAFTSYLTQLTPDTKYYVRAYVTNKDGTVYGETVTFSTFALGELPAFPPDESMLIDFSNFTPQKKSGDIKGITDNNWKFVASVVSPWNSLITGTLSVPVASFNTAIHETPVLLGNNTCQLSTDFIVASVTFHARLTGQTTQDNILWKMYISKDGNDGFSEFQWIEGTSVLDGSSGQWILNESQQNAVPILQIDWTKSGSTVNVKYTYLKDGDSFKTSYIEYGLTTGDWNAYYNIHYFNSFKFSDVGVEWSSANHSGRVKCIDYLGDEIWHSWDANLLDIPL